MWKISTNRNDHSINHEIPMSSPLNSSKGSKIGATNMARGASNVFLDLTDDMNTTNTKPPVKGVVRRFPTANDITVDLEEIDLLNEVDENDDESCNLAPLPQRTLSITFPYKVVDKHVHNNMHIRSNKTVELKDCDFLRIKSVLFNCQTGEIKILGHRLQRQSYLNGIIDKTVNEVAFCYHVDINDARSPEDQSMAEVTLDQVVKLRSVRYTNKFLKDYRFTNPKEFTSVDKAKEQGGLTSRWKYTSYYPSASQRLKNRYSERRLERIAPTEASAHYSVPQDILRAKWRGETALGGSYSIGNQSISGSNLDLIGSKHRPIIFEDDNSEVRAIANMCKRRRVETVEPNFVQVISLTKTLDPFASDFSIPPPSGVIHSSLARSRRSSGETTRQYTYGDVFCGAGGATRGAVLAGLKVLWGVDFNELAGRAWRSNFQDTTFHQMDTFDFIQAFNGSDLKKVDILHMSPPCQYFAPCHTVDGRNDEANSATLLAVEKLLEVGRSRIVTLEQTLGLEGLGKHRPYFNKLIRMFTDANFSITWGVIPLKNWGLPARRNRLIIIASCPGEILPRMPLATHSESGREGLQPFVTVKKALARLKTNPVDDPDLTFFKEHEVQEPWDSNQILKRTITTGGGEICHPSGKRKFTIRELAALQGFPPNHNFWGHKTNARSQIGNAVPPSIAKHLFRSIIKDLKAADGVIDKESILIE